MDDKKKPHSISMRPSEWSRVMAAAQAKSRQHGPTSTGHVVSASRFVVEAALVEAERVLDAYDPRQRSFGEQAPLFTQKADE